MTAPSDDDYSKQNDGGAVYRVRPGVRGKKELVAAVCQTQMNRKS